MHFSADSLVCYKDNHLPAYLTVDSHMCSPCVCVADHDIDDLEMQVVRYKPEGLDTLCRNTKFSRKELQIMYRGFKQVRRLQPPFIP